MALLLAFLPTAVAGVIQDGILERRLLPSLKPALLWRGLCTPERHGGRMGERVTKTRPGLIPPGTAASARRRPGEDPGTLQRAVEQFGYQVAPYGNGVDIHLPSSFLAAENQFLDDVEKLAFHGAQTVGRMARDAIHAAYRGGDTFTTDNPGAPTTVAVKDVTGFDQVLVNGTPVPVSVANTLPVTIGGTARAVTAVAATDGSSPPRGPGTLTISVALDYAQYDAVVRTDAPLVVRQGGRATDRLIVAGDTPTAASFRAAAAHLRQHNVPGLDGRVGSTYGCFVDAHVENSLFADSEFHDAIQSEGLTGPFASGAMGDYAGIRFIRNTEMTVFNTDAHLQANVHESIVFGSDVAIEAYTPESEFAREVPMEGIATGNHYKMPLDPNGVLTLVVRGPLDKAGEILSASWLANVDHCVPTDAKALTGTARVKRAVVVKTAGPAAT